jgi:hypothetical protein
MNTIYPDKPGLLRSRIQEPMAAERAGQSGPLGIMNTQRPLLRAAQSWPIILFLLNQAYPNDQRLCIQPQGCGHR